MQNILDRTVTLVLAGGRGERLAPLTCERSKPAVPFGDRCIIDFVLENCLQSNLNHPFIVTQYQSAHLTRHVGRWWRCHPDFRPNATAAPVCVPAPQTNYAGTASALFRNLRLAPAGTEHVLVLSADHIYDMDYRNLLAAHAASGADVTLGSIVYPSASSHQFGILEVDATDHIVGFQEKPRSPRELPGQPGKVLANMGVYVFRREALGAALAEDAADPLSAHDIGRNILPKLVTHLKVSAFRFEDPETGAPRYWRDVGTIDSYYEASMEWLRRLPASHQLAGSRSVIFPEAHVHPSAEVIDSVLLPGVVVGPKARVRGAILDENVQVMRGGIVDAGEADRPGFTRTVRGVAVVSANTIVAPRADRSERRVTHFEPNLEGLTLPI